MNYRSSHTTTSSHCDRGWTGRIWLSTLLLLLTISTSFMKPSATFAQQEGVWSGVVTDEGGNPLPALVSINGVAVQTGDDGRFEVKTPAGENGRNVINATMIGYASISRIHRDVPLQGMQLAMQRMQRFDIQPDQPIEIEDEFGTRISIPAGGLMRESDGAPIAEPVILYLHTYDWRNGQMIGDMTAISAAGETVVLKSFGAFEAEFRNEKGERYNLIPGTLAFISVPVLEAKGVPDAMPLWYYSLEKGRWIEDGNAMRDGGRYGGYVSHFTPWNFDLRYIDPDLADAPDSSTPLGRTMTTYPSAVTARFPTNFNDPIDPGPYHDRASAVVWLGMVVTTEDEAMPPAVDADFPNNNIDPNTPYDDRDGADDGIHLPLTIPQCGRATLNYDVNTPVAVSGNLFFNVWFDFNRDGDWEDTLTCLDPTGNTITVTEWAVRDEFVSTPAGLTTLTTMPFPAMNPPTPWDPMWMRATLTTQTAPPSPFTGIPAGGGPVSGHLYGETEDYYLTTSGTLLPPPTPTPVSNRGISIPFESLNKAVSLLFPGIPDDTVEMAIKFANTLNAEPERYAGFFRAMGNAFIAIGQGVDPQSAIVEVVRSQPELAAWYDSHGGADPQPALIIIIIIIILVCIPLFAR